MPGCSVIHIQRVCPKRNQRAARVPRHLIKQNCVALLCIQHPISTSCSLSFAYMPCPWIQIKHTTHTHTKGLLFHIHICMCTYCPYTGPNVLAASDGLFVCECCCCTVHEWWESLCGCGCGCVSVCGVRVWRVRVRVDQAFSISGGTFITSRSAPPSPATSPPGVFGRVL